MSEEPLRHSSRIIAQPDQPLIAIPLASNGHEQIVYFTDDAEADQVLSQQGTRQPIKLAGVWSDLDADAMLDELDRLRHRTTPTPPITSLDS